MKKVTYPTEDGGAIHEYVKEKKMGTETKNIKIEKLYLRDLVTGEEVEFNVHGIESTNEPAAVLEESVPDGINIHISGSDINRISDINICFKEDK